MGVDGGRYAYLTSGWVFSEIIRGVTNKKIDEYFQKQFIKKLRIGTEMFYPVPHALVKVSTGKTPSGESPSSSQDVGVTVSRPLDTLSSPGPQSLSPAPSSGSHRLDLSPPLGFPEDSFDSLIAPESVNGSISPDIPGLYSPEPNGSVQKRAQGGERNQGGGKGYAFELDLDQLLKSQSITRRRPQSPHRSEKSLQQFPLPTYSCDQIKTSGSSELKVHSSGTPTFYPFSSSSWSSARDMVLTRDESDPIDYTDPSNSPPTKIVSSWLSGAPPRPPSTLSPHPPKSRSGSIHSDAPALQTARTPRETPRGTDILSRFTSSRREIGVARISNKEVMEKLNAAKRAAAKFKKTGADSGPKRFKSKYLHKLTPAFESSVGGDSERVSAIELAKSKPHVLDPLIFDSRRLHHLLIPPTNCRSTARALARFYGHLASGKLISRELLNRVRSIDD